MPKLKTLFDASPMVDIQKTGVGYYVEHLIRAMAGRHSEEMELDGYYFDLLNHYHKQAPDIPGARFSKIWLVPGKLLSICRRLGFQPPLELFIAKKSDVVLFTNYVSLPLLRKRKTALAIYDLSFLDHPEYLQGVNLSYLTKFCPPSITRADLIITISEFTRQRLLHHFPDLKAEIVITPIPPHDKPAAAPLTARLQDLGIKPQSYLLYLGTIEPRKNIQNLVIAYTKLPADLQKSTALVLAGGKGWKDEEILQEIAAAKSAGIPVVQTGYISDEEKSALYAGALSFVLPSHYEGFGMPILEAMQYSIPVAASDIPVFREVAADAALYFDKDDPAAIATALEKLITTPDLRKNLAESGTRRLGAFSWEQNADRVLEGLRKLS